MTHPETCPAQPPGSPHSGSATPGARVVADPPWNGLHDATTGEAAAWREGFAEGQRQATAVLLPMLQQARADLAAAQAELDAAPTGLEERGA